MEHVTKEKHPEYFLTDITKVVCALIILAGHSYMADVQGLHWIERLAVMSVEMFFVFSGYFITKTGILKDQNKVKNYVQHLLIILMVWLAIYFMFNLLTIDKSANTWFIDFVLLNVNFFCSLNSGHFWYIQCMLLVIMVLYCLNKTTFKWKEIIVFLLISALFYDRFSRAALGIGFGILIAQKEEQTDRKKRDYSLLIGIAAVLAVILVEPLRHGNSFSLLISFQNFLAMSAALALTYTVLRWDVQRIEKKSPNTYYIRKISTIVYLVHLIFIQIASSLVKHLLPSIYALGAENIVWCASVTLITIILSVVFGIVIVALSKYKSFRWLKILY